MGDLSAKTVLLGQIDDGILALTTIEEMHQRFLAQDLPELGRRAATASLLSDILEHYYTSFETLFLRISQYFENELIAEKWHQDLLDKMTIEVPGVRQRVVSRQVYERLRELLRFRHFRRYYYELDYDWDKLDYLNKKLIELIPGARNDLAGFRAFVEDL